MKILIPVDETDRYKSVVAFIAHLRFEDAQVHFFHAVAPIAIYDDSLSSFSAICETDLLSREQEDAKARLIACCSDAKAEGFKSSWTLGFGYPALLIPSAAQQMGADLVAVASPHKTPVERLVSGSVALDLVENFGGDLLIVRTELPEKEDCSMVYATTYSEGSEACLDRMLGWNMKGIAHVEVLNAFKLVAPRAKGAGSSFFLRQGEIKSMMKTRIQEKTEQVALKFIQAGVLADGTSIEMPVEDAIRQAMQKTHSDLIVLAAQPHGAWLAFLEHSTAVHEIKDECFSLLLLRETSNLLSETLPSGTKVES